jgi:fructose-bisphosphate aldolase class II
MTTARTPDLLAAAAAVNRAVCAFNVITLEHAEGVVDGLAQANAGGIIQLSERALQFHGENFVPVLAACASLIASAPVPIALHLDHIQDVELARRLVDAASQFEVSSIMVDFAHLDRAANVSSTREAVEYAHAAGLFVEAELGEIGGKNGAHAHGARTDPDDARQFTAETGIDALAVAIGSSHAMTSRDAPLDLGLLARLRQSVTVPLVLHGSSGVSEIELAAAVTAGIRKVNVGTALNLAYTAAVRGVLSARPELNDPREYLRAARAAVSATVVEFCRVVQPRPASEGMDH